MPHRSPSRFSLGAVAALRTLGGISPVTITLAIVIILLSGAAGDALSDLFTVMGWADIAGMPPASFLAVGVMAVLVVALLWVTRRHVGRLAPSIYEDKNPAPVRALILTLSAPNTRVGEPKQDALDTLTGRLDQRDAREAAQTVCFNWRMPLEAIAHHLPRLDTVVVITTAGDGGSDQHWRDFQTVLSRLMDPDMARRVRVARLTEFLGDGRYAQGVDASDADVMFDALSAAHTHLHNVKRYPEKDILMDVTGGTKLMSVLGGVLALPIMGRSFQYVDTGAVKAGVEAVRTYDITFELQ